MLSDREMAFSMNLSMNSVQYRTVGCVKMFLVSSCAQYDMISGEKMYAGMNHHGLRGYDSSL